MDVDDWDRRARELHLHAQTVRRTLVPGMSLDEARRIVAADPPLSLREVDADDPVVTLDFVPSRIDVYVRNGVIVADDDIADDEPEG